MPDYKRVISKFSSKKILVVGDVILDQYIQGTVSRISPEAPVPVVLETHSFHTPGGAANVASNLKSLGAKVTLVSKVGKDEDGKLLIKRLRKDRINTKAIFVDSLIPTITKTRVIAQNQQIVRIDREKSENAGNKKINQQLFTYIEKYIGSYDAVIISDYGKGLISPDLIRFIVDLCILNKKIITVDPKVEHFSYYQQVTAITPNLSEAENAIRNIKVTSQLSKGLNITSDRLKTNQQIDQAGKELLACLDLDSLLVTLGERGMRLFEKGKKPVSISTRARAVFDVTGAGDAVISIFTLAMAVGASKRLAANLANFGAGIVVNKLGAATVTKEELLKAIR